MKYQIVVSASRLQFEDLIQKEMSCVIKKRKEMYQSLYESVKHHKDNQNVIRMKQLMEEGKDTEILELIPLLVPIKKE